MSKVGKLLQSFELFTRKGVVNSIGDTQSDDEFGCLWASLTVNDEVLENVNCGQLVANKLLLAVEQGETIEMAFVRYNNGEKDFSSITAIRTSMGVIRDVDFAVEQLTAGAARMRKFGWTGFGISAVLIVTVFLAVVGIAGLVPSYILLKRSKRPLKFAQALRESAAALH